MCRTVISMSEEPTKPFIAVMDWMKRTIAQALAISNGKVPSTDDVVSIWEGLMRNVRGNRAEGVEITPEDMKLLYEATLVWSLNKIHEPPR